MDLLAEVMIKQLESTCHIPAHGNHGNNGTHFYRYEREGGEREKERERKRERQRDTKRQRETERKRQTERQRQRDRQRERKRGIQGGRETDRQTARQ